MKCTELRKYMMVTPTSERAELQPSTLPHTHARARVGRVADHYIGL